MTGIAFVDGALCVDAAIIGKGLGFDPSLVQARMREGKIKSLCERGLDEDAGRYRLTFSYESRRFRLLVDEEGNVLRHSLVDFGNR
jgi:hypothetical protein